MTRLVVVMVAMVAACGGGGGEPTQPNNQGGGSRGGGGSGGGGGGGGGAPGLTAGVSVNDNAFSPPNVTLLRGGVVTWTWSGGGYGALHNVSFGDGTSSGNKGDGTFQRTFPDAGTFLFSCTNHGGMNGSVIVQ